MSLPRDPAGDGFERPALGWFLLLDGGATLLGVLALSERAGRACRRRVPLPRRPVLVALLAATVLTHACEAAYATRVARRAGIARRRWTVQTAVVGFPSLRKLRAVERGLL